MSERPFSETSSSKRSINEVIGRRQRQGHPGYDTLPKLGGLIVPRLMAPEKQLKRIADRLLHVAETQRVYAEKHSGLQKHPRLNITANTWEAGHDITVRFRTPDLALSDSKAHDWMIRSYLNLPLAGDVPHITASRGTFDVGNETYDSHAEAPNSLSLAQVARASIVLARAPGLIARS